MRAYVSGDTGAFTMLYRRYCPLLRGVMKRYLDSAEDAEDLVQTTFMKLHRARSSYRPGTPVRPWLFMIARNTRRDHLRAARRTSVGPGDVDAVPTFDDPGVRLDQRRRLLEVQTAIDRLSATLRRTVELHWAHDLSFREIAAREGVRQGTARVRAHRARTQLREWTAHPVA